jgi:Transposase DNA-binding/Transposase DDE domain
MEAPTTSFGTEFFGKVDLKNKARNERLVELADVLIANPQGTFPKKFHDPAQLKAFYRLMNKPAVTHASVLTPAVTRTRELMAAATGTVLVIHDWTELDYTGHTSMKDVLGQIGNGSRLGYVCANALAIVAETREVLGLAAQILFHRPDVGKTETRDARRERVTRESRLWRLASEQIPVPGAGRRQVEVADRGADVLEYLDYVEASKKEYLVRSKHDRRISAGGIDPETGMPVDAEVVKLHELARSLPLHGRRKVVLPARPGQARREAVLAVAFAEVTLRVPAQPRGQTRRMPLPTWVVVTREVNPPEGVEPLEWILLTNVPVRTTQDAWERVQWYECRWGIEEYHKVLKTGCGIEQIQFTTEAALQPAIALISVTAVRLLNLRDAARQPDAKTRPASEIFPPLAVVVLSLWRYKQRRENLSVHDFCMALARLGGHQNRKGDGLPGWITLWRGWSALQPMLETARLFQLEEKCG